MSREVYKIFSNFVKKLQIGLRNARLVFSFSCWKNRRWEVKRTAFLVPAGVHTNLYDSKIRLARDHTSNETDYTMTAGQVFTYKCINAIRTHFHVLNYAVIT